MEIKNNYAGFGVRFLATILDTIWMYGIIYAVLWGIFKINPLVPGSNYTSTQLFFEYIIPFIIVMGCWIYSAATPGKYMLKLTIVDSETGAKVPASRLVIRYIGYFIAFIPLGLGFLSIIWDKKRQGWHDKMAKTVVIKN